MPFHMLMKLAPGPPEEEALEFELGRKEEPPRLMLELFEGGGGGLPIKLAETVVFEVMGGTSVTEVSLPPKGRAGEGVVEVEVEVVVVEVVVVEVAKMLPGVAWSCFRDISVHRRTASSSVL